jgi:ribosomal-protein-alanine N-acetyltransferase
MLEEELYNDCASYLVAEDAAGQVLGYAGVQVILDEGYITNVAVRPAARRSGIASSLLDVFVRFAAANALRFLTLEVRPSNADAIALYEKFGFTEAGRRKNYYEQPKEDALIMTRFFKEESEC